MQIEIIKVMTLNENMFARTSLHGRSCLQTLQVQMMRETCLSGKTLLTKKIREYSAALCGLKHDKMTHFVRQGYRGPKGLLPTGVVRRVAVGVDIVLFKTLAS